jgi:hypothetical protein
MKYRILIQKTFYIDQTILSWHMETGDTPWETENKETALAKYKELLQKHAADNLTLISPVAVDISISA